MKCVQCGAVIGAKELICPYCGAVNEDAVSRKKELDKLEEDNLLLKKEILDKSKSELRIKIHNRVNIVLLCVFIVTVLIGFGIHMILEENYFAPKGTEEEMYRYYEEGDYEKLYLCMSSGDLFDAELRYKYGHMAFLWNSYDNCQTYFAKAHQSYIENGVYDSYYLESCVEYGCEVLIGQFSYDYKYFPDENIEKIAPYQEQVMLLFAGIFRIPEELITEMYEEEYYSDKIDLLTEYVLEVLPNED